MSHVYSKKDAEQFDIADRVKEESGNLGISYCTVKDEDYPGALKNISDRPAVLGNVIQDEEESYSKVKKPPQAVT